MKTYVIVDYESCPSNPTGFTILTTAYKDHEVALEDFKNIVQHVKDDYDDGWINYEDDDIFSMSCDDYVRFIRLDTLTM